MCSMNTSCTQQGIGPRMGATLPLLISDGQMFPPLITPARVKDAPDTDESLTLLSDVQELKRWLGAGALWDHEERAKAILTKLDMVSVACDKKEAKRFSQVG